MYAYVGTINDFAFYIMRVRRKLLFMKIAGSESAFDDLYRHYERLVYYIAYKTLKLLAVPSAVH